MSNFTASIVLPDAGTTAQSLQAPGHLRAWSWPCLCPIYVYDIDSWARYGSPFLSIPWWRHQTGTFSALLALCAGNSRSPVNSPHKDQWREALMFDLICAWTNVYVNNRDAGDLRRHHAHYDVIVMQNVLSIISWKCWYDVHCLSSAADARQNLYSHSHLLKTSIYVSLYVIQLWDVYPNIAIQNNTDPWLSISP